MSQYGHPEPYSVPEWASGLAIIPKTRIPLAMVPTPVHRWHLPGVPNPFCVWVKRDDLTGCSLTGNKVRKTEFILADAVEKDCDCIVTVGGAHSNHARVMSLAARELGLDCVLFIQTQSGLPDPVGCQGNMMLSRLAGATVIKCPKQEGLLFYDDVARISTLMQAHVKKLRAEGRRPYLVPAGGACPLGEWGYMNAWEELRSQRALESIDDVVVTGGSGGTACAIAISNYLTESKIKVHAISISDPAEVIYNTIRCLMQQFGVKGVEPSDLIDIVDEYTLGYYGRANKELKELVISVISETGITVDTVYTGKAVWGMLSEMRTRPERFRGNRVLFIHTGGIFNTTSGALAG